MGRPSCRAGDSLAVLTAVFAIACGGLGTVAIGQQKPSADADFAAGVEGVVRDVCDEDELPALAALVIRGDRVLANVAVGLRRADRDVAVTVDDRWHLGSCTKSMTATLLAILVERELLAWDFTLGGWFAEQHPEIEVHADLDDVTLDQLLRHRSGLAANPPEGDYVSAALAFPDDVRAQRLFVVRRVLARPAANGPAGSKEVYSNLGYMVAGAFAETVSDKSWEDLVRLELFEPLDMKSAGFGPPGEADAADEPFGHVEGEDGERIPRFEDNPAALGPAGTVHASLADWAKYVRMHLQGLRGHDTPILSATTLAHLHDPRPNPQYAAGWVVTGRGSKRRLWHNGSNTMWYVEATLLGSEGVAVLVATNAMAPRASEIATRRILSQIRDTYQGDERK